MLLTLLSLFTADADACSPSMAMYFDSVPETGSLEVPVDAVFKIEMGGGYLFGTPDVILRHGEEKIDVDVVVHKRTIDLIEEHIVIEVTPLDHLVPEREYVVEMADSETSEMKVISTVFVAERLTEEIEIAPEIVWLEDSFISLSEEEMNSCAYSDRTDLFFDFGLGDENDNYSINLYRVDANLVYSGAVITEENLGDRFHTVLRHGDYSSLSTKIEDTTADEEYCFVARYSNAAGQEGPLSAAVCSMDYNDMQWECGTVMGPLGLFGCSNIGPGTASLFTMMMSVFGLVRRRRE